MAYTFREITGIGTEIFDESPVFIPWYAISAITASYQSIVEIEGTGYFWSRPYCVYILVFWAVVGIASAIGFFLTFGERRMEKTEEISDSWFGFRILIPIYAICGALAFKGMSNIILWISFDILALIGYTVYRRGFHYKISDIGILILCMLISLNLV